MISFLLRYYFDGLANWVVLTPLFLSFIMEIGFFLGDFLAMHLIITLVSSSLVCVNFFAFQKKHQKMFSLFPVPTKTFIAADYLFLSGIILSYCTYSVFIGAFFMSFIEKQLVFPSATHWLILLCANFILFAIYIILQLTNLQFVMGILPFLIPLFISTSIPYLGQLIDSMPLIISVAVLSFVLSILMTNYFSTRRDIV
ncbi:hypothetical protein [Solibacillus cecembensis]|uniref:hypothetical protein n=1 Tax=Solibacillus cecembensis TaxID=459347 RepID=UPI003D023B99